MYWLLQLLRSGCRALSTRPWFCLTIIAMLALGIAGNACVFSIFDCLFLRPLPFRDAERLVDVDETAPGWNLAHVGVSNPDLDRWRADNSTFESMAFFRSPNYNLFYSGTTIRVLGAQVTHAMFEVLGLRPLIGRNFNEYEDRPGGPAVVLLSYGLWQTTFNGNPNVLGQVLKLDDQPYTIIGILPREALFPDRAQLWVPLAPDPNINSGYYVNGIGRLKPGVSLQQAQVDLLRIHKAMISQGHPINQITAPILASLRDRYIGAFSQISRMLLAGVAVVLLIACVNLAALMLVRGSVRSRELAIRASLGASRGKLMGSLLSESIVLVAIGGSIGALVSAAGFHALVPLLSKKLPQLPLWIHFSLDWRFAVFCLLITGAAAILSGFEPALENSRVDLRGSLQSTGRTTSGRKQQNILNVLVACEIGLALILSVSAGLVVEAFRKVLRVDPGFQVQNVLTFRVRLPGTGYPRPDQKNSFYDRLLERLLVLPGVKAVGATSAPPLGGQWGSVFEAQGGRAYEPNGNNPTVLQVAVTPDYFRAIGMTLVEGRSFEPSDGEPQPRRVAIINETFAKHFWTSGNPVGRRIRRVGATDWLEVIGVLRDEKHYGLDRDALPSVFLPYPTAIATALRGDERALEGMSVILRTSSDPAALLDPTRRIVHQLDPEVPIYAIATMADTVDQFLWTRRTYSGLIAAFALVANLLGAAGIYSTVSYRVAQRTQDIGIRIALGAVPSQVFRQVLRTAMVPVVGGMAFGLIGAWSATRLLETLLFGVGAHDPTIYSAASIGVLLVACLAILQPARRAALVDPGIALRYD